MNNTIAVKIEIRQGTNLDDVIADMIALSGRVNMPVVGEINGVGMIAFQDDTAHDVRRRYHKAVAIQKGPSIID